MSRRRPASGYEEIACEAARIVCEEGITDYRLAKRKAAERLGLPANAALPDNARVESGVIEYQRLYGGAAYVRHLQQMRTVAVQAMRLLAGFAPRLVGGTVSGAVSMSHRVQLHAFGDKVELIDVFLHDRGIPYEQDERDYRYLDGALESVPLVRFEAGEIGVDVAMFPDDTASRLPLSATNGQPVKRLTLAEAERLAAQPVESLSNAPWDG